jgi:hypothetical protein
VATARQAIEAIRRRAAELHAAGYDFSEGAGGAPRARRVQPPFWREEMRCRSLGIDVRVAPGANGAPVVYVGLTPEESQATLAARLQYPQNLLSPAKYDVWEIARDAALATVLEEIEVQYRRLRRQRAEWGLVAETHRRGKSNAPHLAGLDAYRARLDGDSWDAIAGRHRRHPKVVQRRVRELCRATALPWPTPHASIPGVPSPKDCPGEGCAKRRGPAEPCPECPWLVYRERSMRDFPQQHRLVDDIAGMVEHAGRRPKPGRDRE